MARTLPPRKTPKVYHPEAIAAAARANEYLTAQRTAEIETERADLIAGIEAEFTGALRTEALSLVAAARDDDFVGSDAREIPALTAVKALAKRHGVDLDK